MKPSWFEHVDLMSILIGALFLVIAWFMIRTLKKIDANQDSLFSRISVVEINLAELKGEHAMCSACNKGKR